MAILWSILAVVMRVGLGWLLQPKDPVQEAIRKELETERKVTGVYKNALANPPIDATAAIKRLRDAGLIKGDNQ